MIIADPKAKVNSVIEAASALINFVVLSIIEEPAPGDPARTHDFNADWQVRYEAIKDLNVVTPRGDDHLEHSPEYVDRFPAIAFFVDEIDNKGEELVKASLGLRIECQCETFAIGQYELHEIFHAIRSILHLDKSLGHTTGRGGVIDVLQWSSMRNLQFFEEDREQPIVAANFFFEIDYRDVIYQ